MFARFGSLAFLAGLTALGLAGCAPRNAAAGFTLRDDRGAAWSLSAQRGTAVVLNFGFTHCADTCPAALAKLVKAVQALGTSAGGVEIAFVTIDPQRDSPAVLHAFLRRFDGPAIVGLTGTPQQIAAIERAYHVWAQRIPGPHGGTTYDEAHSTWIYLIDARGTLRGVQDDDDSTATLARAIRALAG